MSLETDIFDALSPLVGGRVYPDVAPASAALPRIVYQQVGGATLESLDVGRTGHRNARIQVSVWADKRTTAADLARSAEQALTDSPVLAATADGAMAADYEPETKLYGTRQDFSVWY